jgi:hypothetical protein
VGDADESMESESDDSDDNGPSKKKEQKDFCGIGECLIALE